MKGDRKAKFKEYGELLAAIVISGTLMYFVNAHSQKKTAERSAKMDAKSIDQTGVADTIVSNPRIEMIKNSALNAR